MTVMIAGVPNAADSAESFHLFLKVQQCNPLLLALSALYVFSPTHNGPCTTACPAGSVPTPRHVCPPALLTNTPPSSAEKVAGVSADACTYRIRDAAWVGDCAGSNTGGFELAKGEMPPSWQSVMQCRSTLPLTKLRHIQASEPLSMGKPVHRMDHSIHHRFITWGSRGSLKAELKA